MHAGAIDQLKCSSSGEGLRIAIVGAAVHPEQAASGVGRCILKHRHGCECIQAQMNLWHCQACLSTRHAANQLVRSP